MPEDVEAVKKASVHIGAFNKRNELIGFISGGPVKNLPKWLKIIALGVSPNYKQPEGERIKVDELLVYGLLREAHTTGYDLVLAPNLRRELVALVKKIKSRGSEDFDVSIREEEGIGFGEFPPKEKRKPGDNILIWEKKSPAMAKFHFKRG